MKKLIPIITSFAIVIIALIVCIIVVSSNNKKVKNQMQELQGISTNVPEANHDYIPVTEPVDQTAIPDNSQTPEGIISIGEFGDVSGNASSVSNGDAEYTYDVSGDDGGGDVLLTYSGKRRFSNYKKAEEEIDPIYLQYLYDTMADEVMNWKETEFLRYDQNSHSIFVKYQGKEIEIQWDADYEIYYVIIYYD